MRRAAAAGRGACRSSVLRTAARGAEASVGRGAAGVPPFQNRVLQSPNFPPASARRRRRLRLLRLNIHVESPSATISTSPRAAPLFCPSPSLSTTPPHRSRIASHRTASHLSPASVTPPAIVPTDAFNACLIYLFSPPASHQRERGAGSRSTFYCFAGLRRFGFFRTSGSLGVVAAAIGQSVGQ
ncbi:hypothetical protein BD414DRAFT_7506 [Trametes punicea]|nr:hypothetical protein BD414DRAFT_7506 [Trametes punicea]